MLQSRRICAGQTWRAVHAADVHHAAVVGWLRWALLCQIVEGERVTSRYAAPRTGSNAHVGYNRAAGTEGHGEGTARAVLL